MLCQNKEKITNMIKNLFIYRSVGKISNYQRNAWLIKYFKVQKFQTKVGQLVIHTHSHTDTNILHPHLELLLKIK